jgi:hypothetical protein
MEFDGNVSYQHGGGVRDATGHQWKVYDSTSETLGSGTLVASGSGGIFTWTPDSDGIYRIELRTSHRKSDGSTDGARFIRVFEGPYDSDLSKSIRISGSFSQDSGGYELTVTYKPLDPGGTTTFTDWARIAIEVRGFYANSDPTFDDEYNYHSDELWNTGNPSSNTIFFNGLLLEDSISEDPTSETVTFKMVSPGYALQKMPMTGYYGTVTAETDVGSYSLPVEYPLMFGDPDRDIPMPDGSTVNVVEYIRQADDTFPVHEVSGMNYTDPIYHVMQRHTNYMQWWDVYLEQAVEEPTLYPYSTSEGNVWGQLRKLQDSRLGVLYCSNKGLLYFSRDIAFQDDAWWESETPPAVVMTMTRDNIIDIQTKHNPYRVAQVQLTGMDISNKPYFSRHPNVPDTVGEIVKMSGLIAFSQDKIAHWAARMYGFKNQPDEVTLTALGLNRVLEIQHVVGIDYTDRANIRSLT